MRRFIAKTSICITIPIKNPDSRLTDCISMINRQSVEESFCLLLISSGQIPERILSYIDNTASESQVYLEYIQPETFQHGRTRNLARSLVDADYYVFVTQDAVPANTSWLKELILPLKNDEAVAGAYSKHISHAEHGIFCKSELDFFFSELGRYPKVDASSIASAESQKERDLMNFFSNNSSCIRGSLFKTILPFPEVGFAEDQAWSVMTIDRGFKKAYSCNSVIHHSHRVSPREYFGRGLDEARSFRENHNRRIMGKNPLLIARSILGLLGRDIYLAREDGCKALLSKPRVLMNQVASRTLQSAGIYVGSSVLLTRIFKNWSRDFKIMNFASGGRS